MEEYLQIIVKNLQRREEEFDVCVTDYVSNLSQQVKERYEYENDVKLIYMGKILNNNEKISTYFTSNITSYIICLEDRTKKNNTQNNEIVDKKESKNDSNDENDVDKNENDNKNENNDSSNDENDVNDDDKNIQIKLVNDDSDKVDKVDKLDNKDLIRTRSVLYGFLTFALSDSALKYLLFNDVNAIVQLLRDGDFDRIIEQFLEQSTKINEILVNGKKDIIDLELDSELKTSILAHICGDSYFLHEFMQKNNKDDKRQQ